MAHFSVSSPPESSTVASSLNASDSEDDLPYPAPLTRASFLDADFNPTRYLSTLHNRHQTLEDLRQELRSRNKELDAELLELVNNNYSVFLSLGSTLKGGEDKVEEIRLGLLGFQREITTLKGQVGEVLTEIDNNLQQKREIVKARSLAARLIEFNGRLEELESRLMLNADDDLLEDSVDEDDDEEHAGLSSPARLSRLANDYMHICQMIEKELPPKHPFVLAQSARVLKIKNTILLDLGTAIKAAIAVGETGRGRLLQIMKVYADMGESREGVSILKDSRKPK